MLRKAKFTIEGVGTYEGFTDGSTWNGYAMPLFTKEVADKLAKVLVEAGNKAEYTEKVDGYHIHLHGADEEENEWYYGLLMGDKRLYPIGGGSWIWDEAEDKRTFYEELEDFKDHLHKTVEPMYISDAPLEELPVVEITLEGKSIKIPLNADLYESLVTIMDEEQKYTDKPKGENE